MSTRKRGRETIYFTSKKLLTFYMKCAIICKVLSPSEANNVLVMATVVDRVFTVKFNWKLQIG